MPSEREPSWLAGGSLAAARGSTDRAAYVEAAEGRDVPLPRCTAEMRPMSPNEAIGLYRINSPDKL